MTRVGYVTVVGELNPYGGDPRYALHDEPAGASGARLRSIMGLDRRAYLALHRVNLCAGRWRALAARARATDLVGEAGLEEPGAGVFVLLGRRVAAAFGLPRQPLFTRGPLSAPSWSRFVLLPHPSGRSRSWNTPDARRRCQGATPAALGDAVGRVG